MLGAKAALCARLPHQDATPEEAIEIKVFRSRLPLGRDANMTSFQVDTLPTSLWGRQRNSVTAMLTHVFFLITLPAMVLETPTVYSYPKQGKEKFSLQTSQKEHLESL